MNILSMYWTMLAPAACHNCLVRLLKSDLFFSVFVNDCARTSCIIKLPSRLIVLGSVRHLFIYVTFQHSSEGSSSSLKRCLFC